MTNSSSNPEVNWGTESGNLTNTLKVIVGNFEREYFMVLGPTAKFISRSL